MVKDPVDRLLDAAQSGKTLKKNLLRRDQKTLLKFMLNLLKKKLKNKHQDALNAEFLFVKFIALYIIIYLIG